MAPSVALGGARPAALRAQPQGRTSRRRRSAGRLRRRRHASCRQARRRHPAVGSDQLRMVPVGADVTIAQPALRDAVDADAAAGLTRTSPTWWRRRARSTSPRSTRSPRRADAAPSAGCTMHVDGAFGAAAALRSDATADASREWSARGSPPSLEDKWFHVNYDCAASARGGRAATSPSRPRRARERPAGARHRRRQPVAHRPRPGSARLPRAQSVVSSYTKGFACSAAAVLRTSMQDARAAEGNEEAADAELLAVQSLQIVAFRRARRQAMAALDVAQRASPTAEREIKQHRRSRRWGCWRSAGEHHLYTEQASEENAAEGSRKDYIADAQAN